MERGGRSCISPLHKRQHKPGNETGLLFPWGWCGKTSPSCQALFLGHDTSICYTPLPLSAPELHCDRLWRAVFKPCLLNAHQRIKNISVILSWKLTCGLQGTAVLWPRLTSDGQSPGRHWQKSPRPTRAPSHHGTTRLCYQRGINSWWNNKPVK